MGMPYYPFASESAAYKSQRFVLAQGQGIDGLTQDAVPVGYYNAIWIEAYLTSKTGSAVISVEGSGSEGGNYLQVADPNAFPTTITSAIAFEVSLGSSWAKVRLASVSGTWNVVATPFISGGSSRARPNYYDRNPTSRVANYADSGVAPHALVVRDTYTVPAGKKTYCELILISLRRASAATTQGASHASITYTPVSGLDEYALASIHALGNNVGDSDRICIGLSMHLSGTDKISLVTASLDSGGTVDYKMTWKGTEYDA